MPAALNAVARRSELARDPRRSCANRSEPRLQTGRAHSAIASSFAKPRKSSRMDEKPQDALRKKKDSSMRVAIDLVKSGEARCLCQRRQYRRADGHGSFRAEDDRRHRPSGDHFAYPCSPWAHAHARSGREFRMHRRAPVSIRRDGIGRRRRHARHRAAARRRAQYRRRGDEGRQRRAGSRTAVVGELAELCWLCRRRRYFLGRGRRHRHRWIYRQCRAEDRSRVWRK